MKTFNCLLLGVICLAVFNVGVVVQAQFNCETNNGTLSITGYTGPDGALIIPDTTNGYRVTSIEADAFWGETSLSSVTIGRYVTSIGFNAFFECTGLTDVVIGSSVTTIGNDAFYGCTSLTNVEIGRSVTNMGDYPFDYCTNLSAISFDPNNPVYSSVEGVLLNKSRTTLIECPEGRAGSYAVPASVTNIGQSAFYRCISLTNVAIGNSVANIEGYAFMWCTSLAGVSIGANVSSIGDWPFVDCTNLSAIMVDTNNSFYSSVDGVLFNKGQTTLIQCPGAKAGSHTISNGVTSIGSYAFCYCPGLTNVTVGAGVTSLASSTFADCDNLSAITVDTNNPVYSSLAGIVFNKSQTTLIQYPPGKAGSYAIPDSVTSIGGGAFYLCKSLTSVTIPNSVTSIGGSAFEYCYSLSGVFFQGNAPHLGYSAFLADNNATVYYLPATPGWGATFGGRPTALWDPPSPFGYRTNGNAITIVAYFGPGGHVVVPDSLNGVQVTSIGTNAFKSYSGLSSVTIPNTITNIGSYAFYMCTNLISATIGKSVASIGSSAFSYCYSLTSVMIPNSVTSIGDEAFYECTGLTNITIPSSVTTIGNWAFDWCTSLAGVYFLGNAPRVSSYVFSGDNHATVYYLPGTTGWGTTFGARPTALWNPLIQASSTSFGVRTNQFGFNVTGTTNIPVVVEACTNLASASWIPLQTCTLTNGSIYFADPTWTNYPSRFYRIRSP